MSKKIYILFLLSIFTNQISQARIGGGIQAPPVSPQSPIQQPQQQQKPQPAPPKPQPIQQPQQPMPQQPPMQQPAAPQSLSTFNFGSASVLPFYIINNTKYFILAREARGNDKGTYDDFSGAKDPGESPLITASREFLEEADLEYTINFSLLQTKNFIDIETTSNTECIAAYLKNVTYITNFTQHANVLFTNFYNALDLIPTLTHLSQHDRLVRLEKDRIAFIEEKALRAAIVQSQFNTGVKINATVQNPTDRKWYEEQITLRGFFVKKLRPFFSDSTLYRKGSNPKIRFYYDITPQQQQCIQQCQQQCVQ